MAISGDVQCFVQANNGNVLLGTNNNARIYKSTNNGSTWTQVISLGATASVTGMVKDNNGLLFASVQLGSTTQGVWRSSDNGDSWSRVKASTSGNGYLDITVIRPTNRVVAVGYGSSAGAYNATASSDGGVNWVALDPGIPLRPLTIHKVASSEIGPLAWWGFQTVEPMTVLTNPGDGSLSTYRSTLPDSGKDIAVFEYTSNDGRIQEERIWAAKDEPSGTSTKIYKFNSNDPFTVNSGIVWSNIYTVASAIFNCLYPDPASPVTQRVRTVWAGANGAIYVSYNSGQAWSLATDAPIGQIYAFIRTTSGTLIAGGENGEIFIYTAGSGSEGGGGSTGGTGGTVATNTSQLLGREATCEDEVYVANKFSFTNITHVVYYNGSTYTELQFATLYPFTLFGNPPAVGRILYFGNKTTDSNIAHGPFSSLVVDLTQAGDSITVVWEYWNGSAWTTLPVQDNTEQFHISGAKSVHWQIPSIWTTTTVNSVVGYWVRARITAVGSDVVAPIHDNRYIYTVNLPYIEVDEDEITGDLPALMKVKWNNRADDLSTSLALKVNRLVCGLRKTDRGENFNAYLNISDVQPLFGVTLTKDVDAVWGGSQRAPTNRALVVSYASAGRLNAWNNLATFTFSNTVARDYYGQFRAFLRVYKYGSGTNNWQIRLQTIFGSGGGKVNSKVVFPTAGAEWEVLDLGQISIPTVQLPQQAGNIGDQLSLSVQGYNTATGIGIVLYDLILIPHDEWAVDAIAPEYSATAVTEVKGTYYLDVDSISNPKTSLQTLNRNDADQIVSRYQSLSNGPAILQVGSSQRLWFLAMAYTTFWYAFPEVAGSIQVFKQQRYLGFRGTQ